MSKTPDPHLLFCKRKINVGNNEGEVKDKVQERGERQKGVQCWIKIKKGGLILTEKRENDEKEQLVA